jgi:hypothetical protein
MEVNGRHAPAALPPAKNVGTHWRGWVGPTDETGIRTPDRPACTQVAIPTTLPRPPFMNYKPSVCWLSATFMDSYLWKPSFSIRRIIVACISQTSLHCTTGKMKNTICITRLHSTFFVSISHMDAYIKPYRTFSYI